MHSRIKSCHSVIPVETGIQICPSENRESYKDMDSPHQVRGKLCFRRPYD